MGLYMNTILLSALLLVAIDSIYLYSTKHLFEKHISIIQGSPLQINMYGAVACYIFLVLGLNYFILSSNKSVMDAFILGIVIYGVFETTNVVLFKKWPTYIVVMDTLWGGVLFALTTYIIKQIKV
jgi:uncharacterized membrane protein